MGLHLLYPRETHGEMHGAGEEYPWEDDEDGGATEGFGDPVRLRRVYREDDGASMTERRKDNEGVAARDRERLEIKERFSVWMNERLISIGFGKGMTGEFAKLGHFTYPYLLRIRNGTQSPGRPAAHWISETISQRLSDDPQVQDMLYREGMAMAGFVVPPREILPVPASSAVETVREDMLQIGHILMDAIHKLPENRVKSEQVDQLRAALRYLGAERRVEGMRYGGPVSGTQEREAEPQPETDEDRTLAEDFGGNVWYRVTGEQLLPLAVPGDAILVRPLEEGEVPLGRRIILCRRNEYFCRRLVDTVETPEGRGYQLETLAGEPLPMRDAAETQLMGMIVAVIKAT